MLCISKKCRKEIADGSVYCCYCGAKQIRERSKKKRGNGQGSVYQTAAGTWQCEIRNPRRTKGGFRTKKEALDYLPILRADNKKKPSTVKKLYDVYSNGAMLKLVKGSQQRYERAYKCIEPLHDILISDLTIERLQAAIPKDFTFYKARSIKDLFSQLYKIAMAQQEVTVNLSAFLTLPELEEEEPQPFYESELKLFWDNLENEPFIGYILLMIYSGMMPGELQICKKSMIYLDAQVITGCGLKTKERKKTPLVIADFMVPIVQDLMLRSRTEFLLDMSRTDFYNKYHEVLQTLGCRDLDPYSCRHTTATALALGNKIAPSVIQRVMRHANIQTTQRYIHPQTSDMLGAVNTIYRA